MAFTLCAPAAASAQAADTSARPVAWEQAALDPHAPKTPAQKKIEQKGIFTAVLENDLFTGSDKRYTNGVRFAYLTPPRETQARLNPAISWIPLVDGADSIRFEYALGQSLFTSDDKLDPNPPLDQRPYAGYLYGSAAMITEHADSQESLQLALGVVGPAALGEPVQDTIHHIVGSPQSRGWDTQLENEPAINLTYLQRERDFWTQDIGSRTVDVIPHFGAALGNVYTYANTGATIRFGHNLPRDFGPPRVEPGFPGSGYFLPEDEIGWYLFLSADGRAVAHNIFLDGNTWRDSRSVDKNIFVGDLHAGGVLSWRTYRLAYSYILRSKEYKTQSSPDSFGIVTLSVAF